MTIEEAIKHCEDVAKSYILESEKWEKTSKTWDDYTLYPLKKAEECMQCAEEHRQLAEWLNELKRARVLLKATYELLMKQNDSGYVLNLLSETIFYDEAECDGCCLMEDIENLLEYHV